MTAHPRPILPALRYKNAEPALRELFQEAAEDAHLDPDASMRSNVVTLLAHAWNVSGTIHWQRGWVREAMLVLAIAGCDVPTAQIMRWYRSRISEAPSTFRNTARAPVEILEQMDLTLLAADGC